MSAVDEPGLRPDGLEESQDASQAEAGTQGNGDGAGHASAGEPAPPTRPGWDDSVRLVPLGFGPDAEPVVVDWYGAGAPDLLVCAGSGRARRARVYRHRPPADDLPAHYDEGQDVAGLDGLRLFCPVPNDKPSRFDLVAFDVRDGLVWLPNEGAPDRPAFGPKEPLGVPADLGRPACRVAQIVATDWDDDGLTDLLVGLDDLEGYWPDLDRAPIGQLVGFNQRGGHPGYDRSGTWRGRPARGCFLWLRNVGRVGEPRYTVEEDIGTDVGQLDLAPRPAPLALAWAGRGAWELLIADARGEVSIFRNFGGQRPPVLMEPRPLKVEGRPLVLPDDRTVLVAADLDGDHRMELLYGTADGRVFSIHSAPGRDEARPPEAMLRAAGGGEGAGVWLGGRAVVAAGDLDGDGDLDLIVGDATGRLSLVADLGRPGSPRYGLPQPVEAGGEPFRVDPGPDGMLGGPALPSLGMACPAIVDWVGHGRPDLLVGGAGGEILFLRNNGIRTQPRWEFPKPVRCESHPVIGPPRVRPAAAVWPGLNRPAPDREAEPEVEMPDLIALDLQGFLCVYPRVGPNEVGPPMPLTDRLGRLIRLDAGFGLAGRCALWAGPWTGPDRVDLLVGLPRDARCLIPALTGEAPRGGDLESLPTVLVLENQGRAGLVARPVYLADGRPLVVGDEGCSPNGVEGGSAGGGGLDLLVGGDDGSLHHFRRGDLRW